MCIHAGRDLHDSYEYGQPRLSLDLWTRTIKVGVHLRLGQYIYWLTWI